MQPLKAPQLALRSGRERCSPEARRRQDCCFRWVMSRFLMTRAWTSGRWGPSVGNRGFGAVAVRVGSPSRLSFQTADGRLRACPSESHARQQTPSSRAWGGQPRATLCSRTPSSVFGVVGSESSSAVFTPFNQPGGPVSPSTSAERRPYASSPAPTAKNRPSKPSTARAWRKKTYGCAHRALAPHFSTSRSLHRVNIHARSTSRRLAVMEIHARGWSGSLRCVEIHAKVWCGRLLRPLRRARRERG